MQEIKMVIGKIRELFIFVHGGVIGKTKQNVKSAVKENTGGLNNACSDSN